VVNPAACLCFIHKVLSHSRTLQQAFAFLPTFARPMFCLAVAIAAIAAIAAITAIATITKPFAAPV